MTVHKRNDLFPTNMSTLSEVLNSLKERGVEDELRFENGQMNGKNKSYNQPNDLSIIKTYRFEGMSDPADNLALYLVEDQEEQIAYLMDIYGSESNQEEGFNEFLKRIPVREE